MRTDGKRSLDFENTFWSREAAKQEVVTLLKEGSTKPFDINNPL